MQLKFRTHVLLLLLSACFTVLSAQNGGRVSFKYLSAIQGDTLVVVLDTADQVYNQAIKSAMQDWTLHEHIQYVQGDAWHFLADIPDHGESTAYTLLVRDASERTVRRANSTMTIRRNHLCLYPLDHGVNLKDYTGKIAVAQYQFPNILKEETFVYKLPAMLSSMQQYVTFLDTAEYDEDSFDKTLEGFRNAHRNALDSLTLYVIADDLGEIDSTELAEAYPYALEIVGADSIQVAIDSQRSDVAFLHFDPRKREVWAIQADGTVLYQTKLVERGSFTLADVHNLTKAIGKPYEAKLSWRNMVNRSINRPLSFGRKSKETKTEKK